MAKQHLVLTLYFLATVINCHGTGKESKTNVKSWLQDLHAREKVTNLTFYVQDILTGPNPTNIPVARATSTLTSPTFFGLAAVIDDPVRVAPNNDSDIFGRAEGFFIFASLEEVSLHMTFDLVFTSGDYNGSTLNVVGHNPYLRQNRELSIVGGSGAFRLARGFILVNTVSIDNTNGNAFFQYNVTVLHYA